MFGMSSIRMILEEGCFGVGAEVGVAVVRGRSKSGGVSSLLGDSMRKDEEEDEEEEEAGPIEIPSADEAKRLDCRRKSVNWAANPSTPRGSSDLESNPAAESVSGLIHSAISIPNSLQTARTVAVLPEPEGPVRSKTAGCGLGGSKSQKKTGRRGLCDSPEPTLRCRIGPNECCFSQFETSSTFLWCTSRSLTLAGLYLSTHKS